MLFGGSALAAVVHAIERTDNELEVSLTSPDSVLSGLLSAFALVVLALLLRLVIGWVALGLAYPLARAHDAVLEPRTGWNRHWGTFSDRYKVAKAYRLLRWTHHVRQVALDRVAPGPSWWRRIDPILDVVNMRCGDRVPRGHGRDRHDPGGLTRRSARSRPCEPGSVSSQRRRRPCRGRR